MSGYKTYTVSILLAVVGLGYLLVGGEATWGNSSGDYAAIVRHTVGAIALLLAASTASLRHAISRLERRR